MTCYDSGFGQNVFPLQWVTRPSIQQSLEAISIYSLTFWKLNYVNVLFPDWNLFSNLSDVYECGEYRMSTVSPPTFFHSKCDKCHTRQEKYLKVDRVLSPYTCIHHRVFSSLARIMFIWLYSYGNGNFSWPRSRGTGSTFFLRTDNIFPRDKLLSHFRGSFKFCQHLAECNWVKLNPLAD